MTNHWWASGAGFFGKYYQLGDNSSTGYLLNKNKTLFERTNYETNGIISLLKLENKSKILDVPCGYGRHSIELAKRGYNVTGVDIYPEFLNCALKKAKKQSITNLVLLERDMRDLGNDLYNKFDAVINMFFSFGFFSEDSDNLKTMQEFYNSLKVGGRMLIHTNVSPEMIEKRGKGYKKTERALEGGKYLLIDEEYDYKTKRLKGTWTIVTKKGYKNTLTPYDVRLYSAREFEEMAISCGFKDAKSFGSFKGESFTSDSKELILVARK